MGSDANERKQIYFDRLPDREQGVLPPPSLPPASSAGPSGSEEDYRWMERLEVARKGYSREGTETDSELQRRTDLYMQGNLAGPTDAPDWVRDDMGGNRWRLYVFIPKLSISS